MKLDKKKFLDTPSQTAGPFLHIGCTPDLIDINLFKENIGNFPFENKPLENIIKINGKIFDGNNEPIKDAMIETWQCDEHGIFHTQKGFIRVITNFNTGDYTIRTVKPGRFEDKTGLVHMPHVLFWIFAKGMNRPLVTKMYFKLDELKKDEIFKKLEIEDRISTLIPRTQSENNYEFNIYIQGKKETIFFEI